MRGEGKGEEEFSIFGTDRARAAGRTGLGGLLLVEFVRGYSQGEERDNCRSLAFTRPCVHVDICHVCTQVGFVSLVVVRWSLTRSVRGLLALALTTYDTTTQR